MSKVHVFRYEDGEAATSFAEVAVRADDVPGALAALEAHGMHPEQLWDRGRTACGSPDGTVVALGELLADGELAVRTHRQDGTVTDWRAPRGSLDRRRQSRSRVATSAAQ